MPEVNSRDASDFYDALAPAFDVMTDWEARLAAEGPFLREVLQREGAHSVLDAACGSGGHALALARWGYEVVGADASPGMVRVATGKAAAEAQDVPFVVARLDELPASLVGRSFDAVLCLGNSLPHVLSPEDLAAALAGMAGVLRPGGLLLTQNLNYDLRWRTQPRFFGTQGATQDGQEILVWRFADYDVPAFRIAFNIALFRKGTSGWDVQVHSTPQRPLLYADMAAGLAASGFEDVQAFGQMAWPAPPFDAQTSGDLVVLARKLAR